MQYSKYNQSFQRDSNLIKTKKSLDKLAGKTVFEKYQLLFNYLGYETYLIRVSEENPVEQLIVSISGKVTTEEDIMDSEYLKHHTVIQMMFVNDILDLADVKELSNTEDDSFVLQFFSILPIQFKPDKYFWKLNALLLVLNRILPIGALGLSGNKEIYFRYTLMTETRSVSNQIVLEIINLIDNFLKKYKRKIECFVEGKESLEDITQQVKKGLIANW